MAPSTSSVLRVTNAVRAKAGPIPLPKSVAAPVRHLGPPPADVLAAYETVGAAKSDLEACASALVDTLSETLPTTGAALLRGLPINSPADLQALLQHCTALGDASDWRAMPYEPFGRPREQLDKMDLATNIAGELTLPCHNEMAYNPRVPRRFLLMCLQSAEEGGESLIARNCDLTPLVPPALLELVKQHGVRNTRTYPDAARAQDAPSYMPSWQERCRLAEDQSRGAAEQFWLGLGFEPSDLSWGADGSLVVSNVTTGLTPGKESGGDWFNILHTGFVTLGNGEPCPPDLLAQLTEEAWRGVHAFKMEPGDLLVLDNLRVQHGRLPYKDGPTPRTLLTVLLE